MYTRVHAPNHTKGSGRAKAAGRQLASGHSCAWRFAHARVDWSADLGCLLLGSILIEHDGGRDAAHQGPLTAR